MTEWLEVDGLGGFSMGCDDLVPRRRYHSLLVASTRPPLDRVSLLQGVEVYLHLSDYRNYPLSSFCFDPGVIHPKGRDFISSFTSLPWPSWEFKFDPGLVVKYECLRVHDAGHLVQRWRVQAPAGTEVTLSVRPLFSGRNYHYLHRQRPDAGLIPNRSDYRYVWELYPELPRFGAVTEGRFIEDPRWYYNFQYEEEQNRHYDATEDLVSPGFFQFDLVQRDAAEMIWSYGSRIDGLAVETPHRLVEQAIEGERRRRAAFRSPLEQAGDLFITRRGAGKTIIAGYPWFTDWGRDTFISLRGLCLSTGRFAEATDILTEWSTQVSEGMLPNRFSDHAEEPEYNSVDASLWFIIVCGELISKAPKGVVSAAQKKQLVEAVEKIFDGYDRGTRFGIRHEPETGLLACGVPGSQLTWMDARIGDHTVTPRVGKPVEIQALWYNALRAFEQIGSKLAPRALAIAERIQQNFEIRFWNPAIGCLNDVVDVEHRRGSSDGAIRPNQLLAVGGLPHRLVSEEIARKVVETVEAQLLTTAGLRSLAPVDHQYTGRYGGTMRERDLAYHQGTCWYWLIGPFVEAWVRAHGDTAKVKREARERFVAPLLEKVSVNGLPMVAEIAGGDPPHAPDGCPAQAWSVAELLRLELDVLK